jgi:hypothetical protein
LSAVLNTASHAENCIDAEWSEGNDGYDEPINSAIFKIVCQTFMVSKGNGLTNAFREGQLGGTSV